jgi:hypothetical protein
MKTNGFKYICIKFFYDQREMMVDDSLEANNASSIEGRKKDKKKNYDI